MPGMIKKLLHTRYRVSDLGATVAFYKDVLGLEETSRHTSGRGSQLVFLKAPGSEEEIELCKFDESGPVQVGPDLTHLAFEVDDMEAFGRHCAAKGHPFADPPEKSGSGSIIAFLDAPDGYEIELIQRAR
jgi:lactoylglutathione lyase